MRRVVPTVLCLLQVVLILPQLAPAQQVSLTILHTNDTHSHLLPFSYPSISADPALAGVKMRKDIGGIARRATLVKRMRGELEKRGTTVWLMDAGDFTEGTPFSTEYHGEADIEAMNAAGYNFGTLGNHEFNNSLATLKKMIGMVRYELLCANAIETSTGKLLVPASDIKEVGPLKIGIFGLVTHEAGTYTAGKEGVTIAGEIETAERMTKELRAKADIVIAISHSGEDYDERIASAVPGLDVIVGGHSHSRLPVGQFIWRSDELKGKEVNGTIIVQGYQWGGELGRLDLLFAKDDRGAWRVDRYRARLIPVTADIPDDPTVARIVERYWKPISARYGEVIGQAADDFSDRGDDMAPYNLVADLVREAVGTDLELENMGGIRAPLIKGDITRADLINMDPFDNKIVTFRVTGRQLKDILRKTRPAVSGIRYRLENGEIVEATVGGKAVEDDHVYTAATNTYLAERSLKGIETSNTGKVRLDVVIEQIRKKGTVKPVYDGRRIVIEPGRSQAR